MGITTSGGGAGTVVMAPFATYLITNFDWRTAFIVLGLMAWLIMASFSILLKKDPGDIGLLPDGVKPEAAKITLQNNNHNIQPTGLSLLEAFQNQQLLVYRT